MKLLVVLPLALVATTESDRFNCPPPQGNLTISDGWSAGLPSHIERIMPDVLEVDVACRVNRSGQFVECAFAPRHGLSERQALFVERFMPRMMRSVRTDVPDQKCVATKMTWDFTGGARSEPAPDEAVG